MQIHLGRLIDHVHLVVADLAASKRFYVAALGVLGRELVLDTEHFFSFDELFISDQAYVGGPGSYPHRIHLAFQAADQDAVARFYQAALAAGGKDHGAPGERPYHPGYYAAFVLDPDGNNIEVVFHGKARRSAPSVTIDIGG
jgi:catechol 2,3-dioxygenase-like lactoylglutathione lyase family enzyme